VFLTSRSQETTAATEAVRNRWRNEARAPAPSTASMTGLAACWQWNREAPPGNPMFQRGCRLSRRQWRKPFALKGSRLSQGHLRRRLPDSELCNSPLCAAPPASLPSRAPRQRSGRAHGRRAADRAGAPRGAGAAAVGAAGAPRGGGQRV
jgi:hypothetical protein